MVFSASNLSSVDISNLYLHIYIFISTFTYFASKYLHIWSRGLGYASRILRNTNFPIPHTNSPVPWSLTSGKKTLGVSNSSMKLNYFLTTMAVRVIESPLHFHFDELVLSSTGKTMLTLLIDYSSKQQVSVYNNDCWSFYKPKQ